MKYLAYLAGAMCCVVLLTTCGSYRAIIDDYKDDYYVESVRPGQGVSGEKVTFEAVVCTRSGGLTDPVYVWDFGGGAYPNVSYDAAPAVTLRDGLRSPYQCRLTVKSSCEGGDRMTTYDFNLQVAPLTVLAVTPTRGVGGGTATFSVLIGSGSVTSYMWDFGGAGSPGGANTANPTITFTDVATETVFQGRVIVSNEFEATEFPFTLTIAPKPE